MENKYYNEYKVGDIAYTYTHNLNEPVFKILKLKILKKLQYSEYEVEVLTNKEYLHLTLAGTMNPLHKKPLNIFLFTWLSPTLEDAICQLESTVNPCLEMFTKEIKKAEKKILTYKEDIKENTQAKEEYELALKKAIEEVK